MNEEKKDLFPALKKYKEEHTTENFQKLCVEVFDFVQDVYSSTANEEERLIYWKFVDILLKSR